MNIPEYIEQKKTIQNNLLLYIRYDENVEENYENLIRKFNDLKIKEDKQEIKLLLYLIKNISNNHNHSPNFFEKIEKILLFFKDQIQTQFSSNDILDIFESNKRILLFLIQEKVIAIDANLFLKLNSEKVFYFFPEMKEFLLNQMKNKILYTIDNEKIKQFSERLPDDYDKKRKIGENDTYICELIRKDLIDEFITHVNRKNVPLNSKIENSIYETNDLLNKSNIELIEYAAFFGSIQIFKYLYLNGVKLTPNLWIFGIHGENPEILHILEEKDVINKNDKKWNGITFKNCFEEAIKCFNNDFAYYIESNYLNENKRKNHEFFMYENVEDSNYYCMKYYNLSFLPSYFHIDIFFFLSACEFGYFKIVEFFLKSKKVLNNEFNKISKFIILIIKSFQFFFYLIVLVH